MTPFERSPMAVTSVIHPSAFDDRGVDDSTHSYRSPASSGRPLAATLRNLGSAIRDLVVSGPAVEEVLLAEERGRAAIAGAQGRELAHELERFSDQLGYMQQRTLRLALVALEDDEVLLRGRIAADAKRLLERLGRDFNVASVAARAQEHVRIEEAMRRQAIVMQEESYRRSFATGAYRAIASAIADYRRTTELLAIEASVTNLCKVVDAGVADVSGLPLMASQPSSPHRSPVSPLRGGARKSAFDDWSP